MSEDLSLLVEREVALEQRLGIAIAGLYASQDEEQITVNGEVRTLNGMELEVDLQIIANLYDALGRIISTDNHLVLAEKFGGLDSFSIVVDHDENQPPVTRILLFAKKW